MAKKYRILALILVSALLLGGIAYCTVNASRENQGNETSGVSTGAVTEMTEATTDATDGIISESDETDEIEDTTDLSDETDGATESETISEEMSQTAVEETASGEVSETERSTSEETEITSTDDAESSIEGETLTNDESLSVGSEETEPLFREEISKNRKDVEAMYDLDDEDFEELALLIEEMRESGVSADVYEYFYNEEAVYQKFSYIDTMIGVAMIIYDLDRSDSVAYERYFNAYSKRMEGYDAYIEAYRAIYDTSPNKDVIFAGWSQEDLEMLLGYDPAIQALNMENEQILDEINNLSGSDSAERAAELFARMVSNRNAIAEYYGFENYYEYASYRSYGRDYTIDETKQFIQYIKDYYVPNLQIINGILKEKLDSMSDEDYALFYKLKQGDFDTLDKNYLMGYIESFSGSTKDGFMHMIENKNMIFASSKSSHQSAYQTYLDYLGTSFCLFGSSSQSISSVIHEMGHYYAGLYNQNFSNLDIAETQSQGNELLFIEYLKGVVDEDVYEAYRLYAIYENVRMGIVCAIVDEFERRVYFLDSVEGFTGADFDAIMEEVCADFGVSGIGDMKSYWRIVCPNAPAYYITYSVSMAASMSLLASVENDKNEGREIYRQICEETVISETFRELLERVGLASPFAEQCFIDIIEMIFSEYGDVSPILPESGEAVLSPAA